jgi:hypothetical protein
MVIHKNTRLTPFQRKAICKSYHEDKKKVSQKKWGVSCISTCPSHRFSRNDKSLNSPRLII